jgi:hypothetical protein
VEQPAENEGGANVIAINPQTCGAIYMQSIETKMIFAQ